MSLQRCQRFKAILVEMGDDWTTMVGSDMIIKNDDDFLMLARFFRYNLLFLEICESSEFVEKQIWVARGSAPPLRFFLLVTDDASSIHLIEDTSMVLYA